MTLRSVLIALQNVVDQRDKRKRLHTMIMKILTLNLLYADASYLADASDAGTWEQRRGLVQKVIERHQPDVIGMQEVQDTQLHDLCELLPQYEAIPGPVNGVDRMPIWTRYGAPPLLAMMAWSWWQRHNGRAGLYCYATCATCSTLATALLATTAILQQKKGNALKTGGHCPIFVRRERFSVVESSTSWISRQPQKPNSILVGTWLPRIVHRAKLKDLSGDNQHLTVFNAHLDWWMPAHRRSGQIVANLLNSCYDGAPQVVMGDFNATQDSILYCTLQEQAAAHDAASHEATLHDAWHEAIEQSGPDETYHGGNGKGSFPGRVDHILFRPHARVQRAVTIEHHDAEIYASDHFPLMAHLEW
jgi:endonuclease/exonuclease/phosphatase family metal-dependent hydrolase